MDRRDFLRTASAGVLFTGPFQHLASAQRKKVRITDVKIMIVRGTWDWNLIKVETDSGLYGIGEAYWGWGVKDMVLNKMKPIVVGEDPLNVDKLFTKMLMQSAGAGAIGGVTVTAASGIEIALWDLCGRILETPVCNLLGGRYRDRIRFYRTLQSVRNVEDQAQWKALAESARAEKWGWTAFKFQGDGVPTRADPTYKEPGHDPYGRGLTIKDYRRILAGMETVRTTLGPDTDFAIECHWHYDTQDVIRLGRELAPVNPMWLEDPVPPENIRLKTNAMLPASAVSAKLGSRFATATPIRALAECRFSSAWRTSGRCSTNWDGRLTGSSCGSCRLDSSNFSGKS